jgi:minor histocompatibility antigen H13
MDADTLQQTLGSRIRRIIDWIMGHSLGSSKEMSQAAGSNMSEFDLANVTSATNTTSSSATAPAAWSIDIDAIIVFSQLVLSAVFIIYLGAHGALRRPPSAAVRKAKKGGKQPEKDEQFVDGFRSSDAIMIPVISGVVLIGLYYIIKWLQDPDLINKILRTYMSVISTASLAKLFADGLQLGVTVCFPDFWRDRQGRLIMVDPKQRHHVVLLPKADDNADLAKLEDLRTPFPAVTGRFLPAPLISLSWKLRHLMTEPWKVRLAVYGSGDLRLSPMLSAILGAPLAVLVAGVYYTTNSTMLSNLMGGAMCYSAFVMMSPTSFDIGTLVLWGLFVYDIVMVFYTPYMITVATKLDVPIKMTFEGPARSDGKPPRSSILGLGDIVIPGIFISLALRFDLWMHYQRKIKYEPVELTTQKQDEATNETFTTTEKQYKAVKAEYSDVGGQWGNWLWTRSIPLLTKRGAASVSAPDALIASYFPKPYFTAAMIGYFAAMLTTLGVMLVFEHGQPALLYLVPGVTGAVWLTGLIRGEIKDMLRYTEDGSLDTEDVVVELGGDGEVITKVVGKSAKDEKPMNEVSATQSSAKAVTGEERTPAEEGGVAEKANAEDEAKSDSGSKATTETTNISIQHTSEDVFVFSLSAPRELLDQQE